MPTIQELITTLHRDTAPEAAEAQLRAIIEAVRTQDTLLAAFHSPTRHYFIVREFGQRTAVLFSNRDSFERFAERCKEQGMFTAAVESSRENRMLLFADLWRCGFTRVILDFAPEFVNLHLGDFYPLPDVSGLPMAQRPVLDPGMTGELLWLAQQMYAGKADGAMELEALRAVYHAPFLMPVKPQPEKGRAAFEIPVWEKDGKRCCRLFTDRREWAASGLLTDHQHAIVRVGELKRLLREGFDRLVINPGTGAELTLDAQLLDAAEQAAMGQTEQFTLHSMQTDGVKVTVTDPEEIPESLRKAFVGVLQNHPEVTAAYLRILKRDNALRPCWLLLFQRTEDRGEKAFCQELADAAQPYFGSYDLECAAYEKARALAGNARPFYQKRKFGFLK